MIYMIYYCYLRRRFRRDSLQDLIVFKKTQYIFYLATKNDSKAEKFNVLAPHIHSPYEQNFICWTNGAHIDSRVHGGWASSAYYMWMLFGRSQRFLQEEKEGESLRGLGMENSNEGEDDWWTKLHNDERTNHGVVDSVLCYR